MATIEVDDRIKRTVSFAARMANVTEGEIVRRLIADSSLKEEGPDPRQGVPLYSHYQGHRTRALYFAPSRVEVVDGPIPVTAANEAALRSALEAAGIEFIDENGGGAGVRFRKPAKGEPQKSRKS